MSREAFAVVSETYKTNFANVFNPGQNLYEVYKFVLEIDKDNRKIVHI